jgi:glycosyltransferase involved in cell wall biosynthesis
MRIGVDAWGLSGALAHTGVGQYTSHLLVKLAVMSPETTLVAYGAPGETRPAWLPEAIVWRAPGRRFGGRAEALISRLFVLRRAVASDDIDVFHAPGVHARASLPPVASVGCPIVATVHDLIPLTFYGATMPSRSMQFYRWNLRRALRADAVVTVSEASRSEIAAWAPKMAGRIAAIPNGVDFAPNRDTAALERLGVRRPYILYAGSYEPRKNLGTALSAYARMCDGGLEQHFVAIVEADSGHAPAVQAHLAELHLGERVRLVHSVPEDDLRALYTYADALCFPSLAEGFGFPPLQAAACGVPVVASNLPSIRETLGEHAVYVDTRDARLLADALRRALTDEALRRRLIEEARLRAAEYSWERSARAHLRVFAQVAASRREGRSASSIEPAG